MIKLDPIKIGDSIIWKMKLKNADNTAVNLTGFLIDIDAYNKVNDTQLFNITSLNATANMYISETNLMNGEYSVVIKDTATFPAGDYLVDVEYTSADGFKRSTPTFQIKMVERL
jgi:hypothetical protein